MATWRYCTGDLTNSVISGILYSMSSIYTAMHVYISDVDILYLQTHVRCDMQMHHNAHSSPTKIVVVVVGGVAWHGSSPWQADKQNDKRRSLIFNAVEIPCKIAKNLHTARRVVPPTPFQARVNAGDRVEYLGKCGRSRPTTATRRTTTTTMTAAQRSQSRQTRTMNKNNKNRREAKRREQQQQ